MPRKKIRVKKSVRSLIASSKQQKRSASRLSKVKVTKKQRIHKTVPQTSFWFQARKRVNTFKWGESYTSLLLGIVVVIVGVLFGVSIFRQQHQVHLQQTSSIATVAPSVTPEPTRKPGVTITKANKTTYIVKQGDELWTIAIQFYNDGYKWTDIAKANNLANPDDIFSGNELVIPNAQKVTMPTPTLQQQNTITGTTYVVKPGDDLWDIALRAYADGYKWTDIAKANNLANPDLIFSGNKLIIPM